MRKFPTLLTLAVCIWPGLSYATSPRCQSLFVPVTVPGVPGAQVYGELCLPDGDVPATVELLVHGSSYNLRYWDPQKVPPRYSHVHAALEAGYATFNIDRLGTGKSSLPASNLVTLDALIDSLHQIIGGLRAGTIGGTAFSHVVYFGSSLSTAYGWVLGSRYPSDVDAFVLTGLVHYTKASFIEKVATDFISACEHPRFSGTVDCGYLVTRPGTRDDFWYYTPNTIPAVIWFDELFASDVVSATLIVESAPLVGVSHVGIPAGTFIVPPESSPSRDIRVPTLIVIGDHDLPACGPPDGLDCTPANVLAWEAPYFRSDIVLDVHVARDTGHALPLHDSGIETAAAIHAWLDAHVH
jgi:pimeloyl-ACP methyl ester carboxylesterase